MEEGGACGFVLRFAPLWQDLGGWVLVHGLICLGTRKHTSSAGRVFRDLPTQLRNGTPVAIAPGGLQALKIYGSFGLPEISKMSCLLGRKKPTGIEGRTVLIEMCGAR